MQSAHVLREVLCRQSAGAGPELRQRSGASSPPHRQERHVAGMAIKRPAEPPSPSSTAREARLQLGRLHGDSRPHAVRPDRAGKEQGRPAREGWWSEALQGGMCAASAASSITAPAQQHVDMDWTWDARPGDGSQNSVQVAGGRYRVRPVVDRVNHARPHRRTRGLRDSMVLEGKADLQLPPGRAPSGRAAGSTST